MATTRPVEPSVEERVANAKAGIFDDRLDVSVPPELFGPPTEAEKKAHASERANGHATSHRTGNRAAQKDRSKSGRR